MDNKTLLKLFSYALLVTLSLYLTACTSLRSLTRRVLYTQLSPPVAHDIKVAIKQDQFDDPAACLFSEHKGESYWSRLIDDEYILYEGKKNWFSKSGLAGDFTDILVEVDAYKRGGSDNNDFGILFGFRDNKNFYRYSISSVGYFKVDKQENGMWKDLIKLSKIKGVDTTGIKNHLRLMCKGINITIYINEQKLSTIKDTDYNGGQVGLFAGAYDEAGTKIAFDNFLFVSPPEDSQTKRYFKAMNYFNLGYYYDECGMDNEAIVKYKKAIALNNDSKASAYSHNNIGVIFQNKGLYNKAIRRYKKALDFLPNYFRPHINMGNLYKAEKMYDKVVSEYKKAIAIKPDNSSAHLYLAKVYHYNMKMYDEAVVEYEKVVSLTNKKNASYSAHFGLGYIYYDKGIYDRAIEEYNTALCIYPNDCSTLYNIGLAYKNKGDKDNAVSAFGKYLELAVNDPKQKDLISKVQNFLKELEKLKDEEVTMIEKPVEIEEEVYYKDGLSLMEGGKWTEAIKEFDKVLNLNPKYKEASEKRNEAITKRVEAYYQQAVEYSKGGEISNACNYLEKVLVADPSHVRVKQVAKIYYEMGVRQLHLHRKQALSFLEKAKELDIGLATLANNKISEIYAFNGQDSYLEGRSESAEKWFKKAQKIAPQSYMVYFIRGKIHIDYKEYENAIKYLNKAIEYNPQDAKSYYYLGKCYDLPKTDCNRAIDFYSKALNIDSRFVEAYYFRAVLYRLTRKDKAAEQDFEQVISIIEKDRAREQINQTKENFKRMAEYYLSLTQG